MADQGLAHQLLGLIVHGDAGEDLPVGAGAVVEDELEQLLALGHCGAFFDLDGSEIGLAESLKIYLIFEQWFDFYL